MKPIRSWHPKSSKRIGSIHVPSEQSRFTIEHGLGRDDQPAIDEKSTCSRTRATALRKALRAATGE